MTRNVFRIFLFLFACVALSASDPTIARASCGNGVIDPGELCDDAGTVDGDGCDASCAIEEGRVCFGEPSGCPWQQQDRMATGGSHVCLLDTSSAIQCWGSNVHGQTVPPAGSDFAQVTGGNKHACARRDDGTVACWGYDGSGRATPPPGTFLAVETGKDHNCAIRSDGTLACWGSNLSNKSTPPAGSFTDLGVGYSNACAIDSTGALLCWGSTGYGRSDPPTTGTFIDVACSYRHCCAVDDTGTAQCWGANGDGQGDVPAEENFTSIRTGEFHTCGLTQDARLVCWGASAKGQSEDPEGSFVSISAGWATNCAFRTDGTAHCWGEATSHQLTTPPTDVMLPEVCGDDLLVGTEECDDGNTVGGDGCRSNCTIERCGDGVLDDNEECEDTGAGFGACCSEVCTFRSSGSECRAVAGACDLAETCTGASDTCPADAKSTGICRAAAGACDVAEICDGVADHCPDDAVLSVGTTCRALAGECDLAEVCDGSSATCPIDSKSTAICRGSAGFCDVAESCDGMNDSCPADLKRGAETVCRGSAFECDAAEVCDGSANACPADQMSPLGTACSDDGVFCTEDVCDGEGACVHFAGRAGEVCRAAAHSCDQAESCDGVAEECPEDSGLPDGDDDGTCDAEDTCPDVSDPDQADSDGDGIGDFCDLCTDAGEATKASVKITKMNTPGGDDKLLLKGFLEFDEEPVYDPIATGIVLRIEDATGTPVVDSVIPPGAWTPVTRSGWLPMKNGGFRFRSVELVDGAIQKIILKKATKLPNAISFKLLGAKGDFASTPFVHPVSVTLTLDPAPERKGVCAEIDFEGPAPDPHCSLRSGGSVLICR